MIRYTSRVRGAFVTWELDPDTNVWTVVAASDEKGVGVRRVADIYTLYWTTDEVREWLPDNA